MFSKSGEKVRTHLLCTHNVHAKNNSEHSKYGKSFQQHYTIENGNTLVEYNSLNYWHLTH